MAVERADFSDNDERGADTLLAVRTVTAFIGATMRGPLNVPVPLSGIGEFRRVFGGACDFSFLPDAVAHYFEHGGHEAVVVRVANGARRARLEVPAGEDTLILEACEPGSELRLRVSVDYDRVEDEPACFNLVVQRLSAEGPSTVEDQEFFQAVSVDEASERFVVDVLAASRLVRVRGPVPRLRPVATRPAHPGEAIPYFGMSSTGSDGEELTDYDLIGSRDEGTGLFALERIARLDLLCIPAPPGRDLGLTTFLAAERYCGRRRAMLIWDPPSAWLTPVSALAGLRDSALASPNALTYFPRLRPRGGRVRPFAWLPACGAVAGLLARADRYRCTEARQGVLLRRGFVPAIEVDPREAALMNRHGINVFARAARGHYEFGGDVSLARARSLGHAWRSLERRRLALAIVRRIEGYAAHAAGASLDDARWVRLQRRIKQLLVALYSAGLLAGNSSGQAFYTRPSPRSAARSPRFRFGFALEGPGEFVAFQIERVRLEQGIEAVIPVEGVQLAG